MDEQKIREAMIGMFKREQENCIARYKILNSLAKKGQTLFTGSSLMEQFPVHELLLDMGRSDVVYNRGVGGFTTTDISGPLASSDGQSWNSSGRSLPMLTWRMPSTFEVRCAILMESTLIQSTKAMMWMILIRCGNTCRSQMTERVMKDLIRRRWA